MNKKLRTKMVKINVRYFTKELLLEAARNAEAWDFNRQLSLEAINAIPDDCQYPVEQWLPHNYRHGEPAEKHIRAVVQMNPEGGIAIVDMPLEFWGRLPTAKVRIPKTQVKYFGKVG